MGDDKKRDRDEREEKPKFDKKLALKEIHRAVQTLVREQRALREEVTRIARQVGVEGAGEPSAEILDFLDRYRSVEALGEHAFGAWISVCQDDRLRGGLRTVQMRAGIHARLLEERIKILGGGIRHEVSDERQRELLGRLGSHEVTDAEKLHDFVARYPDIDEAVAPVRELAERLGPDHETRAMLETILTDEQATLAFLHAECARTEGRG